MSEKLEKIVKGKIEINEGWCKGCCFCVEYCPKDLIELSKEFNDKGYHYAVFNDKDDLCIACGICYTVCPDIAITVYKETKK